jgi:hypothetical protein
MKNVLKYNEFADDGVFWMDFNDFLEEFESIYICRNYGQLKEWKQLLIEDEWKGEYAQGLPNAKNRDCQLQKNPQFGIKINGPGKGYMVFRLTEKVKSSKDRLYGYINLQKIDGKPITTTNKKVTLGSSGPVNL